MGSNIAASGGWRIEEEASTAAPNVHKETLAQDKANEAPLRSKVTKKPSGLSIAKATGSPSSGEVDENHAVTVAEFAERHGLSEAKVRAMVPALAGWEHASDFADFRRDQSDRAEAHAAHAAHARDVWP